MVNNIPKLTNADAKLKWSLKWFLMSIQKGVTSNQIVWERGECKTVSHKLRLIMQDLRNSFNFVQNFDIFRWVSGSFQKSNFV